MLNDFILIVTLSGPSTIIANCGALRLIAEQAQKIQLRYQRRCAEYSANWTVLLKGRSRNSESSEQGPGFKKRDHVVAKCVCRPNESARSVGVIGRLSAAISPSP
jgi:hypothetical protein